MGKKTGTIFFAVVCAAGVGFLVKFNKQTGIFRKLPKAAYLTESEAAERPAYQQLDDKEKAVYEALYRGITNKQEFIMMPYEMNGDMYSKVYCILEKQEGQALALLADHADAALYLVCPQVSEHCHSPFFVTSPKARMAVCPSLPSCP